MTVSHSIRRLIRPRCEADAIHETAVSEGMILLPQRVRSRAPQRDLVEAYRLRID